MRYENYERKIRAIKKATDLAHSIRFWIIGGSAIAIVTTCTLLGVKGTTKVENIPNTITFGEKYEPSSITTMGDSYLEYAPEGSNEWQLTQPNLVGKYKVRSVSKNGFGAKTYSKVEHFEILPIEITPVIESESLVYGNEPIISSLPLINGDKLSKFTPAYTFNNDKVTISLKDDDFSIISEDGNDVSFCYDFKQIEKEIDLISRPLSIEFKSLSKEYDGKALTTDEYSITSGQLAEGDQIVLGEGASITDFGTIENTRDITITNPTYGDVTSYYDISKVSGEFEITKINLAISSNTVDREYDGTDLSDEIKFTYDANKLLPGDKVIITPDYENLSTPIDHPVSNSFSYSIVDKDGKPKDSYYQVDPQYGMVNITKRKLSYKTESFNVVYDTHSIDPFKYTITKGSLAKDDYFEWSSVSLMTDPTVNDEGKSEAKQNFFDCDIYNSKGQKVTDYYDINPVYGTVLIKRRSVKIDMPVYLGTYDGVAHVLEDFKVMDSGDGLLRGHHPLLVNPVTALDANDYDTLESKIKIVNDEGEIVSDYYDISYEQHASKVSKRTLSVQPSELLNKVYDGKKLFTKDADVDATKYKIIEGSVATGEKISAKYTETASTVTEGTEKYEIAVDIIGKNNTPTTKNYKLSVLPGDYSINKRTLHFMTKPYNKTYDGTNFLAVKDNQENVLWEMSGTLAEGDSFASLPYIENAFVDANDEDNPHYEMEFSGTVKIMRGEIDVTSNYNIIKTTTSGYLTIEPAKLSIIPTDTTFTYDGSIRTVNGEWSSSKKEGNFDVYGNLPAGHKVTVTSETSAYSYNDNGQTIDFKEVKVLNSAGKDVTKSFNISFSGSQKYSVQRRDITIRTATVVEKFNNDYISDNSYSVDNGSAYEGLAPTDYIEMEWPSKSEIPTCRPKHVSDSKDSTKNQNTYKSIKIFNKITGEEVTGSYNIKPVKGSIVVEKMVIGVDYSHVVSEYNGKTYSYNSFEVGVDTWNKGVSLYYNNALGISLPTDFHVYAHLKDEEEYKFTFAGSYNLGKAVYFSVETEENGSRVELLENSSVSSKASDFEFVTFGDSTLTISARKLIIKNSSGSYLKYDGLVATEMKTVEGLVSGDELYFLRDGSTYSTYVGTSSFSEAEVESLFEKYVQGKNDYECQTNITDIGTYEVTSNPSMVLRKQADGTYKNVSSSYHFNEYAGTINVYES